MYLLAAQRKLHCSRSIYHALSQMIRQTSTVLLFLLIHIKNPFLTVCYPTRGKTLNL